MATTIESRRAAASAVLDVRCLNAYLRLGSFTKAARAAGVTSRFLREAVERASHGEITPPPTQPSPPKLRLVQPDPVDVDDGVSPSEERAWLVDIARRGASFEDVADAAGITVARVKLGVAAARGRGVDLREVPRWTPTAEPLFPITSFTPASKCPHKGEIPPGRQICCMVCHASGLDGLRELKINPKTAPRPESSSPPQPEGKPKYGKTETRRERRASLVKGGAA